MADIVRPLKVESTASGGSINDFLPTEASPTGDFLAVGGIALSGNSNISLSYNTSGQLTIVDLVDTTPQTIRALRTASNEIFDNSSNGFTASNSQAAIEEARNTPSLNNFYAGNSTVLSVTSTTDVVTDLIFTGVPTGTYLIFFSAQIGANASNRAVFTSAYLNGVQLVNSSRQMHVAAGGGLVGGIMSSTQDSPIVSSNTKITVSAPSGTVDIRWRVSSSTGFMGNREMILLRIK